MTAESMEIVFDDASKRKLMKMFGDIVEEAANRAVSDMIDELPKGHGSSIAKEIEVKRISNDQIQIQSKTPVWRWLSEGTGVYNPEHAGAGPGGEIVPIKAKALHFKNGALAQALGFPDENVFLRRVRGIKPRFYFDRYFTTQRLADYMRALG